MNAPRYPGDTQRLPARPGDQAPAPPDSAEAAARKWANLQREREEHEAAVVRQRQEARDTLTLLRARWPELFTAPVPLAAGVARKIQQGLGKARIAGSRTPAPR